MRSPIAEAIKSERPLTTSKTGITLNINRFRIGESQQSIGRRFNRITPQLIAGPTEKHIYGERLFIRLRVGAQRGRRGPTITRSSQTAQAVLAAQAEHHCLCTTSTASALPPHQSCSATPLSDSWPH